VTAVLIFDVFAIAGKTRRSVGLLFLAGSTITFAFGWIYAMATLDAVFLYVATFGGLLMGLGAFIGAEYVRKSGKVATQIVA